MKTTITITFLLIAGFLSFTSTTFSQDTHSVKADQAQVSAPSSASSKAQLKNKFVYGTIGFGLGTAVNTLFALNIYTNKRVYFDLVLNPFSYKAANLPHNYQRGSFLAIPEPIPHDHLTALSFNVGTYFFSSTSSTRFGIEAGPSILWNTETLFTPAANFDEDFIMALFLASNSNYETQTINHRGFGANFKLKAEVPLSKAVGFEFSLLSCINKYHTCIGIDGCFSFGSFSHKSKSPN